MTTKFKSKNLENIDKLNKFIDDNSENIHYIITSNEMYEYLKSFDECCVKSEDLIYYKNIPVKKIWYFHVSGVNFVFKSNYIKFNLPCNCGFYNDEQHP